MKKDGLKLEENETRVFFITIFKNSFIFFKIKKIEKYIYQPKIVFYFVFLKRENMVF